MPSNLSPREALARIAALHEYIYSPVDEGTFAEGCVICGEGWPCETRAILAEVSPEPGGVLDRDRAREVIETALRWKDHPDPPSMDVYLDRLAGCVRPAAIDRDALVQVLIDAGHPRTEALYVAGQVLALVRPLAGVTFTPEDVGIVRWLLMYWGVDDDEARKAIPPSPGSIRALAAQLGAAL